MEWSQVPAEQLPLTLAVAQPFCFSCHIANTMVRQHPELVIDRSRPVLVEVPEKQRARWRGHTGEELGASQRPEAN